ncbi:CPBP family intramembrane glutamic endopeptidase [Streptococcus acidominimus]|uniref:CPBP family intramembrane metalloprotease n=1 Tax=Streptococcus acidominimus TaxID=1326 RepID=A0A1Q8EBP8_STRAI|nr:CPBP family intramembrane glutamic endopeptidase [Streptococcus acidominimus]MBF0848451.1 CPBP family intramembrane metalloprotease [Streptococcus danieliae]MBF0818194.1 CPBP family intramembrane metalloprotease [Streptococcus acidominimus]MBF0838511.1 CPBP family intramembrane metalloprotease [Streptococcus acidominimus]OLF49201.1 hypothetical protein BU200_08680 [Streptococcus acidominimus]TFU31499.1 CPBP family intramembrane metalloprotease [Streptococcus acidominimus]
MVDKGKYVTFVVLLPIVFGVMRYMINQGNYHHHELVFIIFCTIFLFFCIKYTKKDGVISLTRLEKRHVLQVLLFLLLDIVALSIYASIFPVSSGASSGFAADRVDGYSLSLILSVAVFAPIEEELCLRGFVQKGIFQNSWLGIILTSSIFSYLHSPFDVVSFLFYALSGFILGLSYKCSDNLLVPILVHGGYNSFVLLMSFI